MMQNVTPGELNEMDLGVHMAQMEEWNEEPGFNWQLASIVLLGYHTAVIQEDGIGGLHVAIYISGGEGELVSLRVYDSKQGQGHDYQAAEKQDELYQKAWWDGHDSATGRRTQSQDRKKLYTEDDLIAARAEAYKHGVKQGRQEAANQVIRTSNAIIRGVNKR